MRFLVTTPVFNGARYMDETILSVVGQAGPFSIRYHVQDGGSTDETLDKLKAWSDRLRRDFPILCERIEFTFSSEKDTGLYDAVNKGFAVCGDGEAMTWINADDRIEAGTFATVTKLLGRFPSIEWLCGRGVIIDEDGSPMCMRAMIPFARKSIAACIFDGRYQNDMIMQEGSLWRRSLWQTVGGLDTSFRLAGDFDLWRRFSDHADLVVVAAIFGYFRSRQNQLSADLESYHAEIDKTLPETIKSRRRWASLAHSFGLITYRQAHRDYKGDWELKKITGFKNVRGSLVNYKRDETH